MKKETPRSLKREAGLADGLTTVAPVTECLPRGETKAKRSPKEQSAVSGTLIQVSQVVLDHLRRDHAIRWAFSAARLRPARSREALGQPGQIGGGCHPMPSDNSHQPATVFSLNNYGLSLEASQF